MQNLDNEFVAIRISYENIDSLTHFNRGQRLHTDAIGDVFVYPLAHEIEVDIIDVVDFFEDYVVTDIERLNERFAVNCRTKN